MTTSLPCSWRSCPRSGLRRSRIQEQPTDPLLGSWRTPPISSLPSSSPRSGAAAPPRQGGSVALRAQFPQKRGHLVGSPVPPPIGPLRGPKTLTILLGEEDEGRERGECRQGLSGSSRFEPTLGYRTPTPAPSPLAKYGLPMGGTVGRNTHPCPCVHGVNSVPRSYYAFSGVRG